MAEKNTKEIVEQVLSELFPLLGIEASWEVVDGEEEVEVTLSTDDTGVIIGYHGEVLEGLQLVLSLAVSKKLGNYKRVLLEVGDYRKKRTEYLSRLAEQAKERALSERAEIVLSDLKPWERRIIHVMLSEDKEVESESQGEGKDRTLIIRPRA